MAEGRGLPRWGAQRHPPALRQWGEQGPAIAARPPAPPASAALHFPL